MRIIHAGTTVKGAVDDLDLVIKTLEDCGFKDRFYIHCDGALFGLMMPFVKRVSGNIIFVIVLAFFDPKSCFLISPSQ